MNKYLILVGLLCLALLCGSACLAIPPTMDVDGRPFFPLGWYTSSCLNSAGMGQQKAQGMNSILACYGTWLSDSCQTGMAQAAASHGMKIMFEVHRYAVMEQPGYPLSLIDHQVDLLKNEPNMIGWYLIDEPELQGVSPSQTQARYSQIKSRDPNHPIYVVHSANDDWRPSRAFGYLRAEPPPYTDILMTDSYLCMAGSSEFSDPIWKTASVTKYHVDLSVTYGKDGFINVVQTHEGWGLRMPTYAEQRYISYSPIVFGARGLLYWMYNGGYNTEEYKQTVVAPIAREIEWLIPTVLSNSSAVSVSSDRDADTLGHNLPDVGYLFGEDKNGGYLIAVNNTANNLVVNLELTGAVLDEHYPSGNAQIPVLFEGRTVTLAQTGLPYVRTITDNFSPYDVNVYRIYSNGVTVSIDPGAPDMAFGITHLQTAGGNTTALDLAARNCRRNTNSSVDNYFYFAVDDSFAYQGSEQELYIAVNYFDSGEGNLELQYDAVSDAYQSAGSIAVAGSNIWKRHTFHVTDAYFGNRQAGGADFRIAGETGLTFYLDKVEVSKLNLDCPQPVITSDNQQGVPPFTVSFDASASSDPNGSALSYEWDFDGDGVIDAVGPAVSHIYLTGGDYDATVKVTNAGGLSTTESVRINAYNPLAYSDKFSYSDGHLNGNGGWSGTAASHIVVEDQAVKIPAGMGAYSLSREVACGDDGSGAVSVYLNVKRGSGKDAHWSFFIEDPLGQNLACWQGSGFWVQGRVGSSGASTQRQGLTGKWDNLRVTVYPDTKQTEFFFNGRSMGKFSHSSTGAGSAIGRLRFQEVTQYGSTPGVVYLDELALVGSVAVGPLPTDDFTATPGYGQVSLNWTNPSDSSLVGTMIRYKTNGYPSSPTDGTLVCNLPSAPGASGSWMHYGVSGVTCYYTAFTYNDGPLYTPAYASASPYCYTGVSDSFDSYADGDLNGQGGWTAAGTASAQVQSVVAKGGTGRSALMDTIASGATTGSQLALNAGAQGYYYISFDARQDSVGGISTNIVAQVNINSSDTATDILRFRLQKDRIVVWPATITVFPIQTGTWYNVKLGMDVSARSFDVWVDGTKIIEDYPWNGTGTDISRIVMSSSRITGFSVQQAYIDNLSIESRPPSIAEVKDEGDYTLDSSTLRFSFDPVTCAGGYRYCIGTAPGSSDIRGWTACASGEVTAAGLSLAADQHYFISVQPSTFGGSGGELTASDGIMLPLESTIPEAKRLEDGSVRAIRGAVVSAVFSDCFYIQNQVGPYGMKVVSSAAVNPGDLVDVVGAINGAGAERCIDLGDDPFLLITQGPGVPDPVAMNNKDLGGEALHPLAPGVVDGVGPNNIGLLVRCWGRVSDIDGTRYRISDGSGVTVTVVAPDIASVPEDGEYVVVTGISSLDAAGERVIRVN